MSTTLLFVELLIIGLEVLFWLLLLAIKLFGTNWLLAFPSETLADLEFVLLPFLLTAAYTLGIIFDRLWDKLFLPWDKLLRRQIIPDSTLPLGVMRYAVSKDNEHLEEQFEYTKSRLRIARSSAVNFAITTMLAVALVGALPGLDQIQRKAYIFWVMIIGITLSATALFAWRELSIGFVSFVRNNYDAGVAAGKLPPYTTTVTNTSRDPGPTSQHPRHPN